MNPWLNNTLFHAKLSRRLNSKRAFSFIEILIGLTIGAILTLVISRTLVTAFSGSRSIAMKGDLESIRLTIQNNISCTHTMTVCSPGVYIPIKRKNGSILIASNGTAGTRIGDWSIRASCSNGTLAMERAQPKSDGTFQVDPILKCPFDWQPLFPIGAAICDSGSGSWSLESSDNGMDWTTVPGSSKNNSHNRFGYIYEFTGSGSVWCIKT